MRRKLILLSIVLIILSVFIGCTNENKSEDGTDETRISEYTVIYVETNSDGSEVTDESGEVVTKIEVHTKIESATSVNSEGNTLENTTSEDKTSEGVTTEYDWGTDEEDEEEETTPSEPLDDLSAWQGVFISKVYGNGGNNDGAAKYGFIELYNSSANDVNLDGLSLYYATDNNKEYQAYNFEGTTIKAGNYLLIRCREGGTETQPYDETYEIIKVDLYDIEWDIKLDNREIRLILAKSDKHFDKTAEVAKLANKLSYFVASDTEYFDTYYVDDMSKNKIAVRTVLTDYSGFYKVNLTKSNTSKLEQIVPTASTGKNSVVKSMLNEVYFSENAGYYTDVVNLELTAGDGYTVYYTTDGSDPRTSTTAKTYSEPIKLTSTAKAGYGPTTNFADNKMGGMMPSTNNLIGSHVIKAYATDGNECTGVYTNTYFIATDITKYKMTVMSLSMDKRELCGNEGFYNHYTASTNDPDERGLALLEVFDDNGQRVGYSNVELAVSGHGSSGWHMKSMRVYFSNTNNQPYDAEKAVASGHTEDEYTVDVESGFESDLHYDLFEGHAKNSNGQAITEFGRLLLRNSGNDCAMSYIRDAYMQRICEGMNVDTMAYAPVLVFINGEFWGLYNARERYSGDYVEEHYGLDSDNIAVIESDYSQVHTDTNADFVLSSGIEGDQDDFNQLVDFIRSNDLSNAENFAYVASKLDLDSFTDMYVARIYYSARDWPENNIKIWRDRTAEPGTEFAKWHFTLLDTDMGMSMYPRDHWANTSENSNFFGWINTTGCVIGTIMNKLIKNENYKNEFIVRFYDCVNQIFVKNTMKTELDRMVAERKEAFKLQIARWPSDGASQEAFDESLTNMYSFINKRNSLVITYLCSYFGITEDYIKTLSGSYVGVTFNDARVSSVKVNDETIDSSWTTSFDGKIVLRVEAVAKEGYEVTEIVFSQIDGTVTRVDGDHAKFTAKKSGTVSITVKRLSTESDTLKVQSGITATGYSTFYLDENGNLYAWGLNENGILGTGKKGTVLANPTLVMDGVAKVETCHSNDAENDNNYVMTAVLTLDGEVYTIGNSASGRLGRDGSEDSWGIINFNEKVKDISVGHDHFLILDFDGTLWGVGNNSYGQLGAKNEGGSTSEFQVIAHNVVSISAGRRNTAYIDENGDCYVLGDGRWNKFNNSTDNITTPYKLLSNVEYISSGEHEMILITGDGKLYYTGWRSVKGFAQGIGTAGPALITTGVEKASILNGNLLILKSDGKVYGYGLNIGGALGKESTSGTPHEMLSGVKDIAAGYSHSVFLMEDGTIKTLGDNSRGQYGNGKTDSSSDYVSAKFN